MATPSTLFLFMLFAPSCFSLTFPLTSQPRSKPSSFSMKRMLSNDNKYAARYSMALFVSLPVGTPAQEQKLLLDTGSQLSWVQCSDKVKTTGTSDGTSPSTASFNPTVSSSFSSLSCNAALCKPPLPDFTIPTACDPKQQCYYSYFYADGTLAEGNLVAEKTPLSSSPLILGCSKGSSEDVGILGMNTGRLSVVSQSRISKFSYCIPARSSRDSPPATGAFVIGENINRNSSEMKYVSMMNFSSSLSHRMPNLDPFAYTLPMRGIRVGSGVLNVSAAAFRPNAGGSGQTFVDSGSELTYLVDEAYEKVREAVGKVAGPLMKKEFSFAGVADMCFDVKNSLVVEKMIGGIGLEFEGGVEIAIEEGSVLMDAGDGVKCVAIGRSSMLGSAANIIGNVHQQNLWVQYDLVERRIGFGKADCSKSYGQR